MKARSSLLNINPRDQVKAGPDKFDSIRPTFATQLTYLLHNSALDPPFCLYHGGGR
ncbi:hypothetical protein Scep_028547 [Stephania cephalantha]|uniref:Uncharacterized protein n=1 Tax=Stephania cephalantha TaxID=152367 RepID=A0AAP0EC94_9MAGN